MSTEKPAPPPPSEPEKNPGAAVVRYVRDDRGRFQVGTRPPTKRPRDPTFKALAIADREKNFDFIQGLRDDPKASIEYRFEAAKLLVQYSDGKPITVNNAVQVNVNSGGATAPVEITAGMTPQDAYQLLCRRPDDSGELLRIMRQPSPAAQPAVIDAEPVRSESLEAIEAIASPAPSAATVEIAPIESASSPGELPPSKPLEVAAPSPPAPSPVPPEVRALMAPMLYEGCDVESIRRVAERTLVKRVMTAAALERQAGRHQESERLLERLTEIGLGQIRV